MKKIINLLVISGIALITASCASYVRVQTTENQSTAFDCTGLHLKQGSWHFTDDFGQNVLVTGSCAKGMRHGTFDFYVDNEQVARTKFIHNVENKTTCFVNGSKARLDLNNCMKLHASAESKPNYNGAPNVNAQQF